MGITRNLTILVLDNITDTFDADDGSVAFDQNTFDQVMGFWLPGFICSLGLIGNALSLMVLSRDRSGSVTFISLRALAASDLLLLLGAMLQQVVPFSCLTSSNTGAFCRYQGYVRVYSWPLVCIAQMCSIWMTVLISSERYVAICYPLRATRTCSANRMRRMILAIYALSVIFNIPKFFEFRPATTYITVNNVSLKSIDVGFTELRENLIYRYLYNTGFFFLVIYAFPMITLTVLNIRIVTEIKSARKNWDLLQRTRKKEFQATVLPLVIVLVYFMCGTPALIAFILDAIFVHNPTWLQIYTAVVNLLVIVNSAANFILMYVFGKKFRIILTRMFTCSKRRSNRSSFTSYRHKFGNGTSITGV